jgi:hypothetical protein
MKNYDSMFYATALIKQIFLSRRNFASQPFFAKHKRECVAIFNVFCAHLIHFVVFCFTKNILVFSCKKMQSEECECVCGGEHNKY